jgi:DNA-binding CsgD family transcriptional regulator
MFSAQRNAARYTFHRLYFSPETVRTYVPNIMYKLQMVDRTDPIVRVRAAGSGEVLD